MRRCFAELLYSSMKNNKNIILLTGDLGYGMFDKIREDLPEQFINCGSSEQLMLSMAVGLSHENKTPVVYSITPFAIFRPFEIIRTYINYEIINVKIIGGGRNDDYPYGISHSGHDDVLFMKNFENVHIYYPLDNKELGDKFSEFIEDKNPCYLNIKR
jgi:transketolase